MNLAYLNISVFALLLSGMWPQLGIDLMFVAYFSKAEFVMEDEVLLYDYNNLVADIGGFLGLLLGVSCLAVYDMMAKLFRSIFNRRSNS